jgi:predicted DNA-binding antitoxin AbrB/MazE fold protein
MGAERLWLETGNAWKARYNGVNWQTEAGMTITVDAVYSGGVLRPNRPLALKEGEIVAVTLMTAPPAVEASKEDDVAQRLKNAKDIAEWVAATRLLPPDDGGYDVLEALNANRAMAGEQPLIPDRGTP